MRSSIMKKCVSVCAAMSICAPSAVCAVSDGDGQVRLYNTGNIVLADQSGAAAIYIDAKDPEYDGLSLIAESVASDIEAVTGKRPKVVTEMPESGVVLIAGVVDEDIIKNENLEWEISNSGGSIDSADWERYQIQVKEDGQLTKVIIAGADKRGTIYGMFHITQDLGGVSPWVWWGDVAPAHQDTLSFTKEQLECVSKRPTVNYRGIFLNNEAPSLSTYVKEKFGNYNYLFYANVCELMLRLKGNYLWPAMWGNVFSTEGVLEIDKAKDTSNLEKLPENERDELANARIAEDYGVVIGLSHHEPMARAGLEWQRIQRENPQYTKPTVDNAALNEWNYFLNSANIYDFWADGIARNKVFDNNLITIGMRGEGDTALANPDGTPFTLQQNVDLLKSAITDQKKILTENGMGDDPQMFAIYTEVQQYWYGYDAATSQTSDALKDWDVLKNDIIVLCDDNFGYTRFLTYPEERERRWGMYYHFDMNGGAHSYKWIDTVPLTRVWENMTKSYDYGLDDLWIVNVGDLKPLELPISYFIDLGYDYEGLKDQNPNLDGGYSDKWVEQQFGSVLSADEIKDVSQLLIDYTDLNGRCKPEILFGNTFSTVNHNEAQEELAKAISLEQRAEEYWEKMKNTALADAFYQLVYYPAAGTANVNKMLIYQGYNEMYSLRGSMHANTYAALVNEAIERDKALLEYYNHTMSGGKWKYMQNQQLHTCYSSWNDESASWPEPSFVTPAEETHLLVDVPNSDKSYKNGETAVLPDFDNTEMQQYNITMSTTSGAVGYTVSADKDWIKFTGDTTGSFTSGTAIGVYVDFSALTGSESGTVTVTVDNGETVKVTVNAKVTDTQYGDTKTFYPSNGAVVIGADDYINKGSAMSVGDVETHWELIEGYGKWGQTMKMYPTTETFVEPAQIGATSSVTDPKNAPWLEYSFYVPEAGTYNVIGCFGHSNNLLTDSRLRYGVQIDNGDVTVAQSITDNYGVAGISTEWNRGTRNSGRLADTQHELSAGVHTLKFYGYDPDVQLQRIVLTKDNIIRTDSGWKGFSGSFFGPDETYSKGDTVAQSAFVYDVPEQTVSVPGTISGDTTEFIAGTTAVYNVAAVAAALDSSTVITLTIDGETAATLTYDPETAAFTGQTAELAAGAHTLAYALSNENDTVEGTVDSFTFTADDSRTKIEIVSDDFEDSASASPYKTYIAGDGDLSISGGGTMIVSNCDGWVGTHGVKLDITELVEGKSGLTFGGTADVTTSWACTAQLFIETVSESGETNTFTLASESCENDAKKTLSGEAENVTFSKTDKVYLCVTQWSGYVVFDNISLWAYSENKELFKHTFNANKAAEAALYEPYDSGVVAGGSSTVLKFDKDDSSKTYGVKINLTEKIGLSPELSGATFGASAFIKPGYSWSGSNSASIFFETVSGNGDIMRTDVCTLTGSDTNTVERFDSETGNSLSSNWLRQTFGGEAAVSFGEVDTVYLCITSTNQPIFLDDITMYYMTGTAPDGGEKPSDDNTGNDDNKPGGDDNNDEPTALTIPFTHSEAADWASYTLYDETDTIPQLTKVDSLQAQFNPNNVEGRGWNSQYGVKLDITDAVKAANATALYASADLTSFWWGDTNAQLFIEIVNAGGETTKVLLGENGAEGTDGTAVTLSGANRISFGEGDTICLCITHPSSYHETDNVTLRLANEDELPADDDNNPGGDDTGDDDNRPGGDDPTDKVLTVTQPAIDGDGAYVTASNSTDNDAAITVYAAAYDADGTLESLKLTNATVSAGAENVRIDIDASEGDTVFVWDSAMKAFMNKTEL